MKGFTKKTKEEKSIGYYGKQYCGEVSVIESFTNRFGSTWVQASVLEQRLMLALYHLKKRFMKNISMVYDMKAGLTGFLRNNLQGFQDSI